MDKIVRLKMEQGQFRIVRHNIALADGQRGARRKGHTTTSRGSPPKRTDNRERKTCQRRDWTPTISTAKNYQCWCRLAMSPELFPKPNVVSFGPAARNTPAQNPECPRENLAKCNYVNTHTHTHKGSVKVRYRIVFLSSEFAALCALRRCR